MGYNNGMNMMKPCIVMIVAAAALCVRADVSKFDSRIAADTAMASADGMVWIDAALKGVYEEMKSAGALDGKLHYLPCDGMLPTDGEATHDYIHPNDYGSVQMGCVFAKRMSELL